MNAPTTPETPEVLTLLGTRRSLVQGRIQGGQGRIPLRSLLPPILGRWEPMSGAECALNTLKMQDMSGTGASKWTLKDESGMAWFSGALHCLWPSD